MFKQMMKEDMKIFLNEKEYAMTYDLNGETATCIVETTMMEAKRNDREYVGYDGYHTSQKRIYVETDQIEKPIEGQIFKVDNEIYLVEKVTEEEGLLIIDLGVSDAG